jgi:hypothetical protein
MCRTPIQLVGSSLIALLVVGPVAGRHAVADDAAPTVFQRAIRSWMGVVTLLAEDGAAGPERHDPAAKRGDGEPAERGQATRSERGGREGRGPREWSRDRGPGPRGPGWRMHAPPGAPPMHGMHGMHGMGAGSAARLDEIAERLARIERKLDAAPRPGNPWSPRPAAASRPGFASPGGDHSGRALPPEMQERIKDMMAEGRTRMAEAREKMEQARRRFAEMEERIRKLEAEVERLKAGTK